jgi:hypothetical protein
MAISAQGTRLALPASGQNRLGHLGYEAEGGVIPLSDLTAGRRNTGERLSFAPGSLCDPFAGGDGTEGSMAVVVPGYL